MTTRERGQRKDQFVATLTVDGVACGTWDSHEGGNITASGSSRRVSGGKLVQLGSQIEVSQIKLTRLHRLSLRAQYDFLRTRAGKGECVVSLREKDPDGFPAGEPFVHTGVLGEVPLLTYDETSSDGNDQEITIDVDA